MLPLIQPNLKKKGQAINLFVSASHHSTGAFCIPDYLGQIPETAVPCAGLMCSAGCPRNLCYHHIHSKKYIMVYWCIYISAYIYISIPSIPVSLDPYLSHLNHCISYPIFLTLEIDGFTIASNHLIHCASDTCHMCAEASDA